MNTSKKRQRFHTGEEWLKIYNENHPNAQIKILDIDGWRYKDGVDFALTPITREDFNSRLCQCTVAPVSNLAKVAHSKIEKPSDENYEKKILRHLYLLAKYHADQSRMRSNDLIRKEDSPNLHHHDRGLADAYESICFYLLRPELLENMDYNKIMKTNYTPPSWLSSE
jgi:hypothetical protein